MNDWVKVKRSDFLKTQDKEVDTNTGVIVRVFFSPYEVPEAIKGAHDKDNNLFIIDFKYIGSKEPTEEKMVDSARVKVGKYSNRIYQISLPEVDDKTVEKGVGLELLLPQVETVIDSIESDARKVPEYRDVMKRILKSNLHEIHSVSS